MIASTTIIIKETEAGIQRDYRLGDGDVFEIARSWITNCGLPCPRKFSVFVFGGKKLFITNDRPGKLSIEAIEVKGSWRLLYLRYWLRAAGQKVVRWWRSR